MTNHEYVEKVFRASIRELAKFDCPSYNDTYDEGCKVHPNCLECWEDWLKIEVTENDNS